MGHIRPMRQRDPQETSQLATLGIVAESPFDSSAEGERATRIDARASREAILSVAADAVAGDRRISMVELAAAAGVGRSTLYRHFPSRSALDEALERRVQGSSSDQRTPTGRLATLPYIAPGRLGRDGLALEVTHVLDEVPPHLVPDQLVAEARRAGGVPVGLYVVDIDGSRLIRLAGTDDFPDHLDAPPALGPEIVPEGLSGFQRQLGVSLPGCTLEPLWLRGRITALFLCVGTPVASLADIAKQGAAALDLANDYTDAIEAARRRKPPTPAAEIQQNLLPPRIARITGGQLAGGLLPTYEVGGDWFDFVENRDGSWLAIGDAAGNGPTAAGLGAAALGALRASRRSGQGIEEALLSMDETVRRHQGDDLYVSTVIARWQPATSMLTWVNCGHPHAYLVNREGSAAELTGPDHAALGRGRPKRRFRPTRRQLYPGERILLVTDGVTDRRTTTGVFGIEGVQAAVDGSSSPTAAATAMALLQAVSDSWAEPLEDDGTVVVLCVV